MKVYYVKDYFPKVAKNIDITALFGARGQAVKNKLKTFQKEFRFTPCFSPIDRGSNLYSARTGYTPFQKERSIE